jgi:hypothetical protein
MQTARLIAGHVRADNAVLGRTSDDVNEPTRFARLSEIMASPPERGTNRVIVGHNNAFTDTEGGPYLQEGESAIFKAIDRRRVMVARLRIEDWHAYAFPANKVPPAQRSSAPDKLLQHRGMPLVSTIRFGGYTIYVRNAATDPAQDDKPAGGGAADCRTQRNLSAAGREQANAIGIAFATMRLPIGEVVATTSCSALQTAQLVSRMDTIRSIADAKLKADDSPLGTLLATPPSTYQLRIVVGDADSFNALAGPPKLDEGEAVVLRATDAGGWVILARLPASEWVGMPAAAGFPPL